jgi:hypothetical protein
MEGFENIWAGAPSMFTVCECGSRIDDCFIPVEERHTFFLRMFYTPLSLYILYIYIYYYNKKI